MRHRHHLSAWQVFTDVLILLFAWSWVMIGLLAIFFHVQSVAEKDYHPKAEYMIVLNWPDESNVDLDLWLKNPDELLVWYKNKEISNIALDRDSRGSVSNEKKTADGTTVRSGNEEIIAIRSIIPGKYTIAVTYYNDNGSVYGNPVSTVEYTVKIYKVNPVMAQIVLEHGTMKLIKQIDKVLSFQIDPDGKIEVVTTDPESFLKPGQMP